jgi:glycosyltransferase involved in cell wall biosynthesis
MSKPGERNDSPPTLSIVLPCFNEARNLPLLLARYRERWEDLPAELILVDNGSTDDTAATLDGLLAPGHFAFARVVSVPKNRGYGYGVLCGLQAARGEYVAYSHADMQCAPGDVFAAYRKLMEQPWPERALVKGRRHGRHWRDSLVTATMSVLASVLLMKRLTDINAQPKVFHRGLVPKLASAPDGFQFDLCVLYRAVRDGRAVLTVPVEFPPRIHGQSNWAFSLASRYRTIRQTIRYMFRLSLGYDR